MQPLQEAAGVHEYGDALVAALVRLAFSFRATVRAYAWSAASSLPPRRSWVPVTLELGSGTQHHPLPFIEVGSNTSMPC